jgi:hypothetical protein
MRETQQIEGEIMTVMEKEGSDGRIPAPLRMKLGDRQSKSAVERERNHRGIYFTATDGESSRARASRDL